MPHNGLLDVLGLLAHLLDEQLQIHRGTRHVHAARLGAERVGFAVHFLKEKIQPLANAAGIFATGAAPAALALLAREQEFELDDMGFQARKANRLDSLAIRSESSAPVMWVKPPGNADCTVSRSF